MFDRKKETTIPVIQKDKYELVLRCSICSGEQILCMRDREDGSLHELTLIRSFSDLQEICKANQIDPESVKKIY